MSPSSSRAETIARLALLLPALIVGSLVLRYWVNVPEGDDWETPGQLYVSMASHGLTFGELVRLHNESRMVVPRLIHALLLQVFGWDTRAAIGFSWITSLLTWLAFIGLLGRQLPVGRLRYFFVLAVGAAFFSTAQWKNQLWSIQLVVFLPPAFLVAALWLDGTRLPLATKVLGCAALSVLSTFSFANGMTCWGLGFPLRSLLGWGGRPAPTPRARAAWLALYLLLGAATIALYFQDFELLKPTQEVAKADDADVSGLRFFVAWLGAPLGSFAREAPIVAELVGGLLLVAAVVSAAYVAVRARSDGGRDLLRASHPFWCLVLYSALSGIAVTLGRLHYGQEAARSVRYATTAGWFAVALLPVLYLVQRDLRERGGPRRALAPRAAIAVLLASTAAAWPAGVREMRMRHWLSEQNQLSLRLLEQAPENPLLARVHKHPSVVLRRSRPLRERGWLDDPPIGDWVHAELGAALREGRECLGEVRLEELGKRYVRCAGWAILPSRDRAADCVLVAHEGADGQLELVSGLAMKREIPAVTKLLGIDLPLRCGFGDSLKCPGRARSVRVFAADFSDERLYLIPSADP